MEGRLLDARTGEPLPGVYVMSLARRAWADDAALVEQYRTWNAEEDAAVRAWSAEAGRTIADDPAPPLWIGSLNPSATTDRDGRFRFVLEMPVSSSVHGLLLRATWSTGGEPRSGSEVVRVEIPGRAPLLLETPRGTWREAEDPSAGALARWTWGDLRVP